MAGQTNVKERTPAVQAALAAANLAAQATTAYERPDLAGRVQAATQRLLDPSFNVLVVGEFKQGKSSLINSLLNAPVCPVDDDIATSAPTMVRYADEPTASVVFESPESDEDSEPPRQEIPIDQLLRYVTDSTNPANEQRVKLVEAGIPRRLLSSGLVLVDTPGVGGLGSAHATTTIAALPMADAVVFVSDASQEFSMPEIEFLNTAKSMCPNIVCVLTKIDFYPEWRRILELDRSHLSRLAIDSAIIPVSSTVRMYALQNEDRELNAESGFPDLVKYLENDIVADAEGLTIKHVASDLLSVTTQLESQFDTERVALDDPEKAAQVVNQLTDAKERADRLRGMAAKWQQTLNDGIQDLIADVDHDFRARIRITSQQADEAIEESDPAETWAEFEPWLYRRTAEDVVHNYQFLQARAGQVGESVAVHFADEGQALAMRLEVEDPSQLLATISTEAKADMKVTGKGERAQLAFRGTYGGMLPVMVMGGMALTPLGIGMIVMPAAAIFGLFSGRKALKDEKERQLMMRRNQAKNAHRKYTDEVCFIVNRDSKATLRRVQRQLRDYYTDRAEELHRSTSETLVKAQEAAKSDEMTRQRRLRDVQAELERITSLKTKVLALAPALGTGS
ncbi:MAG: Isoniazid-inducible protein iniA [Actinobacteria bacterium]|nr:MAG: Isoniazid-inducible protein iniA [Actinomycetota bacterium]RIK04758.1 MAG: Isoniazid-inducible protein iniA [Acidobacteriota bacterium]